MAPAKKATASHSTPASSKIKKQSTEEEDMPTPRNSITVASRIIPARTPSASPSSGAESPLSSSHSSPTEKAAPTISAKSVQQAAPEVVMDGVSRAHTPASPDTVSNGSGRGKFSVDANGVSDSKKNSAPPVQAVVTGAGQTQDQQPKHHPSYERYTFEHADNIEELTIRQLEEDISAYHYDLDFCHAHLDDHDLTPQETRTLQLRTLDLGHQIRHCLHKIEQTRWQLHKNRPPTNLRPIHGGLGAPLIAVSSSGGASGNGLNGGGGSSGRSQQPSSKLGSAATQGANFGTPLAYHDSKHSGTPLSSAPGKRPAASYPPQEDEETSGGPIKKAKRSSPEELDFEIEESDKVITALQRLGFWNCRLCSAPKYLLAGTGRTPAMPCKWPLKDISKMITHFTEMHSEHEGAERCAELGDALAKNRGPFEYWLRKTRAQSVGNGTVIDEAIAELQQGRMPQLLRRHSRAAASMAT
ncbi:hypothetical protein QBC35DRAFT_484928 [Podospora australis]|uniref:Uncharacterized protein n=1 Tax=Podospora australis TaxID=1536484 RepID=A0AAN7AM87_9PEZI|nr:hypothetical protein QBC35DRAFT_484928 [Podospora australis]